MKSFFKETKMEKKNILIYGSQHNKNQCNKRKEINTVDIYLIFLTVSLPEGVENNHLIKLNQQNGLPQNRHITFHIAHINFHSSQKHQTRRQ